MRRAVFPGSFDPVTNGHVDIIGRIAGLFDEVVVATGTNTSKNRLFTPAERLIMLERACAGFGNVEVQGFSGLLTDFCVDNGIHVVVKGLRAVGDFDYEVQMAQMNASLAPQVETVFMPTAPGYSFLASSLVKEIALMGGDVSAMVPAHVLEGLHLKRDERA